MRCDYWGGAGDPNAIVNNVWQIDKTTGTVQGLGTSRGAMTMDAASLYITAGSTMLFLQHYVVAIDKVTHVWTALYTIPAGSGGGYGELTVDETYVYRTGRGSYSTNDGISALARIIKCGTQQRSQTIANPITLTHLATDEAFAYGISGAAIVRIRKSPECRGLLISCACVATTGARTASRTQKLHARSSSVSSVCRRAF